MNATSECVVFNRVNVVLLAVNLKGPMPQIAPEAYAPTIFEWGISIGLIAATIFLFGLGARLVPLSPRKRLATDTSPVTQDAWLRTHQYLQPVSALHVQVDEAISKVLVDTAAVPCWENYVGDFSRWNAPLAELGFDRLRTRGGNG